MRTQLLQIRLSEDEKKACQEMAGEKNLSEWARERLGLDNPQRAKAPSVVIAQAQAKTLAQLALETRHLLPPAALAKVLEGAKPIETNDDDEDPDEEARRLAKETPKVPKFWE